MRILNYGGGDHHSCQKKRRIEIRLKNRSLFDILRWSTSGKNPTSFQFVFVDLKLTSSSKGQSGPRRLPISY